MKRFFVLAASAALALTMTACGAKGEFSDTIDEATGAYDVKADNAGKDSAIGALDGVTLEEGQGLVVQSNLSKGTITVRLTDGEGNEVLNIPATGTDTSLNGVASGVYSIGFNCDEDGTTGTLKAVAVDEDVYNEQGGDLEKTLEQMKLWTKAKTADEAAKGAGFDGLAMPADDTELENGPCNGWTYKYEQSHVKAKGFAGAASLVVDKGIYAGDGDISGDVTVYANHWTREINGNEVNCYGNEQGKASKTTWVDGDYMYSIVARGQGSEFDTFGLSEADVTTLVSTIK